MRQYSYSGGLHSSEAGRYDNEILHMITIRMNQIEFCDMMKEDFEFNLE